VVIEHYHDLGRLPHFNPDLEEGPPPEVLELRERVGQAGGLLISCPEYARGIPGSFKNALDWLVAIEEASITVDLLSRRLTPAQIAADATIAPALAQSLHVFCAAIRS
jgi:NAD(P)H-dependent FMN reductase